MENTTVKNLLVIVFLLALKMSQAQDTVCTIELGENQLMYRNIENLVTINSNLSPTDFKIVFKNCDSIRQIESKKQFSIIPGRGRVATVNLIDSQDSSIVYYSKTLKIEYLPNPELFYGMSINGSKITPSTGHLFAKYPPSHNLLSLNDSFEILNWKIIIEDKVFEGDGNSISEDVKKELKENNNTEFISVLAVVEGPDGLVRKIGGVYNMR